MWSLCFTMQSNTTQPIIIKQPELCALEIRFYFISLFKQWIICSSDFAHKHDKSTDFIRFLSLCCGFVALWGIESKVQPIIFTVWTLCPEPYFNQMILFLQSYKSKWESELHCEHCNPAERTLSNFIFMVNSLAWIKMKVRRKHSPHMDGTHCSFNKPRTTWQPPLPKKKNKTKQN